MNQKQLLEKLGCPQDLLRYMELSWDENSFDIPNYESLFEADSITVSQIDIDLRQITVAGNLGLFESPLQN